MIFEGYIQNASYQKLADMLEQRGVPYTPEKRWNKNIVARILKDRHYIGDEEYPPIITRDVFQRAEAANTWFCDSPERIRLVKKLRSMVRCPMCGGALSRNFRANWRCPDCMDTSVKVTDGACINRTELAICTEKTSHFAGVFLPPRRRRLPV